MASQLFHHLVENTQDKYPKQIAVYDKKQRLDYSQLQNNIETLSTYLISVNVSKSQRVAIYLGKTIEAIISFFATSACGAVFVPINPHLKSKQVGHILHDCSPTVLITSAQRLQQIKNEQQAITAIKQIILIDQPDSRHNDIISWSTIFKNNKKKVKPVSQIEVSNTELAAILYTSGSTGKAKGVMLSHNNLICGAQSVSSYLQNTQHDKILALLPFSFDYGLSQLTTAFYTGASVVLLEYLLPKDVIKAVVKHQITALAAVPPLWIRLAELQWPQQAQETLRYITNSGGVLPQKTLKKLRASLPKTKPYLMYGLTEAFRSTYLHPEYIDTHSGSIGKAIPNAEILVVNKENKLCQANEVGELVHCGPLVAMGYWNNPQATALTFRPVCSVIKQRDANEIAVWSGDLVKYDSDGFLYFIERNDEMIKSSGYRISPTEVEEVFLEHHAISNAIAIGVDNASLGQSILLICTIASPVSLDELKLFAKQKLPGFMCPADVIIIKQLPQSANGKIDRQALINEYGH